MNKLLVGTSVEGRLAAAAVVLLLVIVTSCRQKPAVNGAEGKVAMRTLYDVRHITISINRPPNEVYEFASTPANLPTWATGLAGSIKQVGREWIADAPMGQVKIRFAEKNDLGVLDHDIVLESGVTIHNPMRVVPNGSGSEVVFSLFRLPDTSDAKFADDQEWVAKDLRMLKRALER
jgi:hypothetical protein